MTKTIDSTATETDTRTPHQQGADLLQHVLAELADEGYRKAAVDTWRHPGDQHNIRHAYSGGEWTLTCWTDGGGAHEVRWTVRATMPAVGTIVSAVLPPAF